MQPSRARRPTRAVRELDASVPVFDLLSMETIACRSLFGGRMMAALSAWLGALETVLAAIGLYGVMSDAVARRRREIGLRMAPGAEPGRTWAAAAVGRLAWMGWPSELVCDRAPGIREYAH